MTLLSKIIGNIQLIDSHGSIDISIAGLAIDSREVKPGYLFAAISGSQLDGHSFIEKAIQTGATAVLCETLPRVLKEGITYLHVVSSNETMALIARAFYGDPAADMKMIGITGTNGKTTVATLGWQLMKLMGHEAGLFSTVDVRIGNQKVAATHTTPDFIQLYSRLSEMKNAGCKYVFMEVSSHALHQNRVFGINFDVALFTNATRDHLDYHGSFKAYLNAKKLLFDGLSKSATAIICKDDKHADYMVQNCAATIKTYGLRYFGDIYGRILENSISGLTMKVRGHEIVFRMAGAYNAQNLLAAFGIAEALGFKESEIVEKWSLLTGAEGRFDRWTSDRGITGIIDYAHSPDALENLLNNVNEMRHQNNQVITVIGCGGDRDKGKRPMMARVAVSKSDLTILTSDNPRSENPDEIINDMYVGVEESKQSKTFKISQRKEAIKLACQLAKEGDIVVIAGKGHEKYQEINGEKFPFDDKQVLQQYL
jgi:UDP-N-acetylmuramoyl-L-alanyl-D-glutamate--2,6-diaminopimelate ligase